MRFDNKTEVEGYDSDKYLEMYENAEGNTWREKLNAMRRLDDSKRIGKDNNSTIEKIGGRIRINLQFFASKEKQFGKKLENMLRILD